MFLRTLLFRHFQFIFYCSFLWRLGSGIFRIHHIEFTHIHIHSLKWNYEIFMTTLEDYKMHLSAKLPWGEKNKQNMCFVNIAKHWYKCCCIHNLTPVLFFSFQIPGYEQGGCNGLTTSVECTSLSVWRQFNAASFYYEIRALFFTGSHFEVTITAIKWQIYACTKSRLSQGSHKEGGVVRAGAHTWNKGLI